MHSSNDLREVTHGRMSVREYIGHAIIVHWTIHSLYATSRKLSFSLLMLWIMM